ncbi:MAG: hypothetical protein JST54_13610 [Deltaproteobacteria bacterium]|nr:hypothetical protein [Deltaproteobacteria bacterium]
MADVVLGLAIGAMLRELRPTLLLASVAPLLFFSLLFANSALEHHEYGVAVGIGVAPLVMQGVPWAATAFASAQFKKK